MSGIVVRTLKLLLTVFQFIPEENSKEHLKKHEMRCVMRNPTGSVSIFQLGQA